MAKKINPELKELESKLDYWKIKKAEVQREINKLYYAIKKANSV